MRRQRNLCRVIGVSLIVAAVSAGVALQLLGFTVFTLTKIESHLLELGTFNSGGYAFVFSPNMKIVTPLAIVAITGMVCLLLKPRAKPPPLPGP